MAFPGTTPGTLPRLWLCEVSSIAADFTKISMVICYCRSSSRSIKSIIVFANALILYIMFIVSICFAFFCTILLPLSLSLSIYIYIYMFCMLKRRGCIVYIVLVIACAWCYLLYWLRLLVTHDNFAVIDYCCCCFAAIACCCFTHPTRHTHTFSLALTHTSLPSSAYTFRMPAAKSE